MFGQKLIVGTRYVHGYPQSKFWEKKKLRYMYTPVNASFAILKWDIRGYILHGHNILMIQRQYSMHNL